MKILSKTALAVGALLASASFVSNLAAAPLPAPLDSLGPNFLTFNGTASVAYNSNVLSAPGGAAKFDDIIYTFVPGVTLNYGKQDAGGNATLAYSEQFLRYDKHSTLNEELSNLNFSYIRQQARWTFTVGGAYVQSYSNTPSSAGAGLSSIIRTDTISGNGDAHWNFSDTVNFDAAIQYTQNTYLYTVGQAFQNSDTYTVPATVFFVYSPALSIGGGYTYSQTDPKSSTGGPGRRRESNALTLNTELTEFAKVTGSANVGVTQNQIDGAPGTPGLTTTTVSYGMNLSYAYSSNVEFTLGGTRGFTTGTQGQNIENTGVTLGANWRYNDKLSVQATLLNYTYSQYLQNIPTRNDNTYSTGLTVNFQAYDWLTLSAGYTYFMNSSSAPGATYNINVVTLSGSVKY
jgi:hypothetical protein